MREKILDMTALSVLVTRPKPSGEALCQAIAACGGRAHYFPTIEIVALPESNEVKQAMATLAEEDWLIFISPQAVYYSLPAIQKACPHIPAQVKVAAIGEGTAAVLRNAGLPVSAVPTTEWSSEGLMDLPVFQHMMGKKVTIFCGENSREYLEAQLLKRGAEVKPVITYRRILPKTDKTETLQLIQSQQIDIVVCTSAEGVTNLKTLLASVWDKLRHIPLLVISERMLSQAASIGFENIVLAKNASQDTIMDTLNEYKQKGANMTKLTAEVSPSNDTTQAPIPAERQRHFPWSGIGIFISLLVLIALLVAAYFGERRFLLVDAALQSTAADLSNKMTQQQEVISTLQNSIVDVHQSVQAAAQAINELRNTTNNNKDLWSISEAQYLTKLANDNLQIGNNLPLVIRLLQTADQEISHVADAKALVLRKALATDIAAIQAVPTVDTTGIYMQLSALNDQVDKLPLMNNRPGIDVEQAAVSAPEQVWWKRGLKESWKTLRQIVVVRYNASGQPPLVAPEQQAYLYQNLHAVILQAMTAVMNQQPEIYRDSLQKANMWIKQYFMQDAPLTVSVQKNLNTLQAMVIRPELPTLSASLQAFRDYLSAGAPAATSAAIATPSLAKP